MWITCRRGLRCVSGHDRLARMTARRASVTTMMGPPPDLATFLEVLGELPDPRIMRTRRHELPAVLFLCLCAVICGANDLVTIEKFGNARRAFLEKFVS